MKQGLGVWYGVGCHRKEPAQVVWQRRDQHCHSDSEPVAFCLALWDFTSLLDWSPMCQWRRAENIRRLSAPGAEMLYTAGWHLPRELVCQGEVTLQQSHLLGLSRRSGDREHQAITGQELLSTGSLISHQLKVRKIEDGGEVPACQDTEEGTSPPRKEGARGRSTACVDL